jgi:NAD(P)H-dependent FMN reductase
MKLTVFVGSPRGKKSNTHVLMGYFLEGFKTTPENSYEIFYLNRLKETERFVDAFAEAEHVLLAHPLYTDAMPGMVKAYIEALEPLCGNVGNPNLGFIVQSGFGEAAHSRNAARYHKKLAARLGCKYLGTIIKGNCEQVRLQPKMYKQVFETFFQLGKIYGETRRFDEALVQKMAQPERLSLPMRLMILLVTKMAGNPLWDNQLKEYGAYENRFAQPHME